MAAVIVAGLLLAATPVKSVGAVKLSGNNRFLLAPMLAELTLLDDPTFTLRAITEISRDGGVKWELWAHCDWLGRPGGGSRFSFNFPAPPDGVLVRHSLESPKDLVCGLDLVESLVVVPPVLGHQSVAVAGTPGGSSASDVSSFSFSLDVGSGSNTAMETGVSWYSDPARAITAHTYAGTALTNVTGIQVTTGSRADRTELWRLLAPTIGSNSLSVTFAGSSRVVMGGTGMTGVDQATPTGTPATATGASSTPSVVVAGATGDLIFSSLDFDAQGNTTVATVGGTATSRWSLVEIEVTTGGAGSTDAGAASVTMSWTLAQSDNWALVGVAFKAAAGGAAQTLAFTPALPHRGKSPGYGMSGRFRQTYMGVSFPVPGPTDWALPSTSWHPGRSPGYLASGRFRSSYGGWSFPVPPQTDWALLSTSNHPGRSPGAVSGRFLKTAGGFGAIQVAAANVIFRKTLSRIGTRTGSRQTHQ